MTVPSTPTAADRNQHKKDLESEITKLTNIRDTARRETGEYVNAAGHARETLKGLTDKITEITALIPDVSRETREFIAHCQAITAESGLKMTEMVAMTVLIEKAAGRAAEELTRAIEDAKVVHDNTVKELSTLQTQKDDLDIYHKRLKKHFEEHLPGQVINI